MQDGIHDNISIQDYHANKTHISSTQVRIAKNSLKEFDWHMQGKLDKQEGSHFDFGNAFELALLDKNAFSQSVAIMNDSEWCELALSINPELTKVRSSKTYQELSAGFLSSNAGKYIINDKGNESWETIQEMLESCFADKVIQGLIKNTEYQLSLFWTDDQTGVKLKTRPDICKRKKNVVVNVKTALDGSPKGFSKELVKYDYPIQACMEMSGCMATGLMPSIDNYFWLVVEKVKPFNATIYEFDQGDIKASMDELDYIIHKIQKAREQKSFPGYSDRADNEYGILKAEIPMYYRSI